MNAQESLIDQLEIMLASKDLSKRAEVLRHVTDLFIHGSGRFSDEQIDLFDGVMSKLVESVELAARVAFGSRLAELPTRPARLSANWLLTTRLKWPRRFWPIPRGWMNLRSWRTREPRGKGTCSPFRGEAL